MRFDKLIIDVCIPTWNSDRFLERCLQSIYKELDINKIYIIDRYSTDKTLKILNDYNRIYNNIEIIQSDGNLAIARQILISKVNTEFFLFIDADVELITGIYADFLSRINDDVGAIAYSVELTGKIIEEKYILTLEKIGIKHLDTRGFTYCTFIRKKTVMNILIPEERYAFEDQFICDYIRKNGFRWLIPEKKFAIHYNDHGNWINLLKFKVNSGRALRRFTGKITIKKQIKGFIGVMIYACIASIISLDPRILFYMIAANLLGFYGYYTSTKSNIYQDRDKIKN